MATQKVTVALTFLSVLVAVKYRCRLSVGVLDMRMVGVYTKHRLGHRGDYGILLNKGQNKPPEEWRKVLLKNYAILLSINDGYTFCIKVLGNFLTNDTGNCNCFVTENNHCIYKCHIRKDSFMLKILIATIDLILCSFFFYYYFY